MIRNQNQDGERIVLFLNIAAWLTMFFIVVAVKRTESVKEYLTSEGIWFLILFIGVVIFDLLKLFFSFLKK